MKILLINPKTTGYSRSVTLPLGLLSIASTLLYHGHEVCIYDRTVDKSSIRSVFCAFHPELVGISLISTKSVRDTFSLAAHAKKYGLPVVVGGPLASELPAAVLKHKEVDIVSIGEGEETWCELAAYYADHDRHLKDIAGIVYISGNETVFTKQRAFLDLERLPAIDWSLVDVPRYFQSSYGCDKMLYLYSAKGCPNNCAFCFNKDFHRCHYRKRPLQALLQEIKHLVETYGMNGVYFADELWCRNREEMHTTCDALKSLHLDFVWGCQTRIGQFDEDDFRYMYMSGCRWVFFGVESGSERILRLMNKRIPYDKIVPTFSACKKAGITAIASFIIGFPGETEADLKETVALIEKLDTHLVNLNYFALVPGSDIYKLLVAEGKYPSFDDIITLQKMKPIEKMEYKFCSIPDIDIKVIRNWYMWRSFTSKDSSTGKGKSFAKKVIIDALKSIFRGSPAEFLFSAFRSGVEFLSVALYANAYPAVRKKYIGKQTGGDI